MTDNPLREVIARAICARDGGLGSCEGDSRCIGGDMCPYPALADAAIAAIEASGTHRIIPLDDYKRLLVASEADDMIVRCETCGAWLDQDDPATAMLDDFTGCWKLATRSEEHAGLCRSYRALDPEPVRPRDAASTDNPEPSQ